MKNRMITDAVREVRHTLSRFLSLFLLSALAVAFLAGLRTTAPDMEYTADAYYDRLGLMDLRVLSTLGLTDEDVAVLSSQEGVEKAEGAYTVDALIHQPENDLIVKLHSLSEQGINQPNLRSGRLPESDGECLVEPALLTALGAQLGDTLTLDTGDGDFAGALARDTFTIVGTADSPLYISFQRGSSSLGTGKVSAFVLLPAGAFSLDYYTDAYLTAAGGAELLCYGSEYEDLTDTLAGRLEPLGDQRAGIRYNEVIGEANDKLSEAQAEFDDAEREVQEELADAERKLSDARKKLDDGWQEYRDGWATLRRETADARQKIADAEKELPDALEQLEDGERDYADGLRELRDGEEDYADGLQKYGDGVAKYQDGYQELLDGEEEYNDSLQTLQDAQKEYDDGMAEYRKGLQALADGGQQLMDAREELDRALDRLFAAEQQYSAGKAELEAGQAQLTQLQGGYTQLQAGLAGFTLNDPAVFAQELSALTLDPTGMAAAQFHQGVVLSLRAMLEGLRPQLPQEQQAAVDQLLSGLPADADTFAYLLSQDEARMGMARSICGSMALIGQVLPALEQQLQAGEASLASGAEQLRWGWSEYQDGMDQYREAKKEFDQGAEEAISSGQTLSDARAELDEGWGKLHSGRKELDDGWADLQDAKRELEDGEAELNDARIKLDDGWRELADARAELDDGWQEYRDGLAKLSDAREKLPGEIARAEAELADALRELEDGEAEYADGLAEYEDGRAEAEEELSDARRKLNDARRDIAGIENCRWYLLGRNTNMGYVSFQQDAERMGNLASVFPLIFFLVAALVCLTTMTRMVEEQRVQIGSIKALGYSKWAISLKYVGYGFFSSLLGGVAGLAFGCTLIPFIIFNAWKILYTVGDLIIPPSPGICLMALGAAVLCVTGAAVGATFSTLTAVPATLMRPKAPPAGKRVLLERIGPLWRRLSFTYKVTIRNLFRYQKRFWMTVAGIGGCTALIVTAFGLRNAIYDIMDKQFDEISIYSASIGLEDDVTDDELLEIGKALDGTGLVETWLPSCQLSLTAEGRSQSVDVTLFAVEDTDAFGQFIRFRHRLDDKPVVLPDDGAVLTEKLASLLGVEVGDTLTLDGDERVTIRVADITENYILHYVYLSSAYYQSLYGEEPPVNSLLACYTDSSTGTADAVSSAVIPLSGVTSVSRNQDTRDTFFKSLESVDYAVILIIVCAAALAFIVLYNLTNINITERLRELATLKVLGFYDRELSAYVYRENLFLTVFGILVGLVMGKFLHQWLILTVEIDRLMFGRMVRPISYLYAVLLTACFSVLVNLAAHRRLKKIDMVESLKTVE